MEELLKDWLGTIAILVYLLYPLFKRWLDRRKKKQSRASTKPEAAARSRKRKAARPRPRPSPAETASRDSRPGSPADEFLPRVLAQAKQLRARASSLLAEAEESPRLMRLVPALREDLLDRVAAIEVSLRRSPPLSTLMQEATALQGLQELLQYLERMALQRARSAASAISDADRMADACYAPLVEFARAHGIRLRTTTPVVITGDWPGSIVPHFATTRVAPIRVPGRFTKSVWQWPRLAHEIARDFYFSVDDLEADLHERLGLPMEVAAPRTERDIQAGLLRDLFGAWLSEVFADVMGTMMLGPAYVETMRRTLRKPGAPHETAAIFESHGKIEGRPPGRLRLYMVTRVLHHLGRHEEAEAQWSQWGLEHPDVDLYFLPLAGRWVGLSEESVHRVADSIIDRWLGQSWPELADYRLIDIPGFAYLHAEHAEVSRLKALLAGGATVHADPRWIMAAAILAAAEQPSLSERIRDAARRSIVGAGEKKRTEGPAVLSGREASIGSLLTASLRHPQALREAIVIGEAIRPYRSPRWR